MPVDARSVVPLYRQLQQHLENQISNGQLKPGQQLPPEDELIDRHDVSRTTVRRAVQELLQQGLVEIRRGKGTFVKPPKIIQELSGLTGFVEDMVELGLRPSAQVLEKVVVPATEEVAGKLDLEPGAEVFRIKRIRSAEDVPISLDETYLPLAIGQRVAEEDLEIYPIFSLLEEKYKILLSEAEYRLGAVLIDPVMAEPLGMEPRDPILLIERTSYSTDHRPVDYEKLYYRGDKIGFSMRMQRKRPSFALKDLSGSR